MTVNAYARRYSQAIFRMALEQKDLNRWQSDLRKVAMIMKDTALASLISNPRISGEEKSQNLKQRLGDINPLAIKLVLLLAAKDKLAVIDDIAEEYQALVDNYRGIEGTEIAEVTTAVPLDADYQLKIAQRITEIVGRWIERGHRCQHVGNLAPAPRLEPARQSEAPHAVIVEHLEKVGYPRSVCRQRDVVDEQLSRDRFKRGGSAIHRPREQRNRFIHRCRIRVGGFDFVHGGGEHGGE